MHKLPGLLDPFGDAGNLVATAGMLGFLAYGLFTTPRDKRLYLGLAAVIVGISINYVFLPIRAAQYPAINEGEPVGFFSKALMATMRKQAKNLRQSLEFFDTQLGESRVPPTPARIAFVVAVKTLIALDKAYDLLGHAPRTKT